MQFQVIIPLFIRSRGSGAVHRRRLRYHRILVFGIFGAVDGIKPRQGIGRARSGLGEKLSLFGIIGRAAVGQVGGQLVYRKLIRQLAVPRIQGDHRFLPRQHKGGVKGTPIGIGFALIRQIDDLVTAGGHRYRRESPLIRLGRVIRKGEGRKIQRRLAVVVQFHPADKIPILIGQGNGTVGGILIDSDSGVGGRHAGARLLMGNGLGIGRARGGTGKVHGIALIIQPAGHILLQILQGNVPQLPAVRIIQHDIFPIRIDAVGQMYDAILNIRGVFA